MQSPAHPAGSAPRQKNCYSKEDMSHQYRLKRRRHLCEPGHSGGKTDCSRQAARAASRSLDGMICNAGVSGACGNLELIISLNYFGTVAIAKGVYDLLQKKHGSCVVTVSNTISQGAGRKDIVDLLNNIGDEKRVLSLVSSMDSTNLSVGNSLYVSTKYALARWIRRVSATWQPTVSASMR